MAGHARTVDEAFILLDTVKCNGVILDANLNGETVRPIADRLKTTGVPFIVVSGYTRDQLDFLDDTIELVAKPFQFELLKRSVQIMLGDGKNQT